MLHSANSPSIPGSKPYLVRLENRTETDLREKPEERDEDFAGFIKETLGEDLYSSIQMNGEGFDQEWAQRSVKILCYQRRKVFFGNNLFAAGACGAGAEKYVLHKLKEYRYMSSSMVLTDVGMDRELGSTCLLSSDRSRQQLVRMQGNL